jgi:hypothetical protein
MHRQGGGKVALRFRLVQPLRITTGYSGTGTSNVLSVTDTMQ